MSPIGALHAAGVPTAGAVVIVIAAVVGIVLVLNEVVRDLNR